MPLKTHRLHHKGTSSCFHPTSQSNRPRLTCPFGPDPLFAFPLPPIGPQLTKGEDILVKSLSPSECKGKAPTFLPSLDQKGQLRIAFTRLFHSKQSRQPQCPKPLLSVSRPSPASTSLSRPQRRVAAGLASTALSVRRAACNDPTDGREVPISASSLEFKIYLRLSRACYAGA